MDCTRSSIAESIQKSCERGDWHDAIEEMEKLFAISRDPHIRVRIGDVRRKLNRQSDAISEYIFAADLFAHEGFLSKALAQYSLVLRLDASNDYARQMRALVLKRADQRSHSSDAVEYRIPQEKAAPEDMVESISACRLAWLATVAAMKELRAV